MNCKICNSDNLESIAVKSKNESKVYHQCNVCNTIFLDDTYTLNAKDELDRYNLHNNSSEDEGYKDYFRKFYSSISEYLNAEQTILDFGSGPSPVFANVMKEHGYDITIYDKYFHDDKSYSKLTYDTIVSTEVFEHLKDPISIIEHLLSLLKPNAHLIVMTNFHPNCTEKFQNWWYRRDETHITFFSLETFKFLAIKYDLSIITHNTKNIIVLQK